MSKIRWRLVMGFVSLAVTVIVTFPAGAKAAAQLTSDIWPNGAQPDGSLDGNLADIWPNTVVADIWPNGVPVDIGAVDNSTPSD